jgi:DNA (cytosine-5)-methyltransferase 1
MKPEIFSFFAGSGFLDLGFESAGYSVAYVNEFHGPFLDAYKHSRTKLKAEPPEFGYYNGSITDYRAHELERTLRENVKRARKKAELVGFIGGPPCPDFSIGGKNRGRHGDHGKLSRVYVDLICHIKPDFFLFENVKGLWSTKRHRAFYAELKQSLTDSGFQLCERLINSIEYGVPQDRERIILVGFRDSVVGTKSLFEDDAAFPWLRHASHPNRTAFDFNWPETAPFRVKGSLPCPPNIPETLTVEHWFCKNDVKDHPNAQHCFKPRAGLARFESVPEGDDSKKSFKRLHRWRYSPTACYGNNEVHLHPYEARRISVAEALAIQSLPKKFELPEDMTLSAMFKTVGNGVPFLAAKALAKSLLDFLGKFHETIGVRSAASHRATPKRPGVQLHQPRKSGKNSSGEHGRAGRPDLFSSI